MKKIITSTIAALGVIASGAALAQQNYSTPWRGDFWGYIGASAGEAKYRSGCNRTVTLFQCDTKDTAFKVYAGGRMNEVLGLEIGDFDRHKLDFVGGRRDVDMLSAGVQFRF